LLNVNNFAYCKYQYKIVKNDDLKAIRIKIIKFISDDQPGFIECIFYDAMNKKHVVQEKIPVITERCSDANSNYPQGGVIACEIVKESRDLNGNKIVTIDTSRPWGVDSIEGLSQFDVLEEQLIELGR
jgi:hypothetical protein